MRRVATNASDVEENRLSANGADAAHVANPRNVRRNSQPSEDKYARYMRYLIRGGEGGIRTPDTVTRMPHFECGAFNHSATSPWAQNAQKRRCAAMYPTREGETRASLSGEQSPPPAPAVKQSQGCQLTLRAAIDSGQKASRCQSHTDLPAQRR